MELVQIPLAALLANPDNIRGEVTDLDGLVASITSQGLLSPLLVTNNNGDGDYVVIAGNRRLAALQLIASAGGSADPVPCIVHESMEDAQRIETQLVENLQRADLNPLEEANAYRTLCFDLGLSQREAAERVGVDQATISKRLALLRLPEQVQDMVVKGTLPVAQAVLLAKLKDPQIILDLTENGHTLPTDWRIKSAIEKQTAETKLAKFVTALEGAGVEVVTGGLPSGFRKVETIDTTEAAKKITVDDDTVIIATIGYDNEPVLVKAERSYANTVEVDGVDKKAQEREQRRLEREAKAERLAALQAVVTKSNRTEVATLAIAVVADLITYSTARPVAELLNLEPIVNEQSTTDYSTGEIKTKTVKDWVNTVKMWAEQGGKAEVQTAAAVLISLYSYNQTVKDWLVAREIGGLDEYVAYVKASKEAAEAEAAAEQ